MKPRKIVPLREVMESMSPSVTKEDKFKDSINHVLRSIKRNIRIDFTREKADSYYQAYVFCLMLRAVLELNTDRQFQTEVKLRSRNSRSREPEKFIFRGAPGKAQAAFHKAIDFGYAVCIVNEIDVSLVKKRGTANNSEILPPIPKGTQLRGAMECKWYPKAKLELGLIRAFLGLVDEFSQLKFARFVSGQDNPNFQKYCSKRKKIKFNALIEPDNLRGVKEFIGILKDEIRHVS
jgi:hypothetical protein